MQKVTELVNDAVTDSEPVDEADCDIDVVPQLDGGADIVLADEALVVELDETEEESDIDLHDVTEVV